MQGRSLEKKKGAVPNPGAYSSEMDGREVSKCPPLPRRQHRKTRRPQNQPAPWTNGSGPSQRAGPQQRHRWDAILCKAPGFMSGYHGASHPDTEVMPVLYQSLYSLPVGVALALRTYAVVETGLPGQERACSEDVRRAVSGRRPAPAGTFRVDRRLHKRLPSDQKQDSRSNSNQPPSPRVGLAQDMEGTRLQQSKEALLGDAQ